jgi:hypothetical protein
VRNGRVRWRDPYPDVKELRRRIGEAMGVHCTLRKFALLVGASWRSVWRWERGGRVTLGFRPRLLQLDRLLNEGTFSVEDALDAAARTPAPLVASTVSVTLQGGQALLRFSLAVPGEETARLVAEIMVPPNALEAALPTGSRQVQVGPSRPLDAGSKPPAQVTDASAAP